MATASASIRSWAKPGEVVREATVLLPSRSCLHNTMELLAPGAIKRNSGAASREDGIQESSINGQCCHFNTRGNVKMANMMQHAQRISNTEQEHVHRVRGP